MIVPMPDLPDDTPLADLELPTRIRNALRDNGLKTVGEVKSTPDKDLLSFQNFSYHSLAFVRTAFGREQTPPAA
jgi:DNA-directed RNA polymerase alpha subunit